MSFLDHHGACQYSKSADEAAHHLEQPAAGHLAVQPCPRPATNPELIVLVCAL